MDLLRLSDEELLVAARHDARAFGVFYERHERALLAGFRWRTGDAELAADLTAETFAAALVSTRRFKPGGAPAAAWLHGIARNVFLRSLKRAQVEQRARRRLGMPVLELHDELLERIDGFGADERARELLALLRPEQAEAVRGRIVEEESYADLATRLRCSEQVVRQRVSRGLASLRSRLEEGI
jgi:RNA polymerase sigma factor (sigma-70 family)